MVLTNAGVAHLTERAAGSSLTNDFDALALGTGNDTPAVTDTLQEVTDRLSLFVRLDDGYPVLGDTDYRNTGREAATYTWRFTREAGEPWVASNVAVTNYSGGVPTVTEPLLVHLKQTVAQRYDERLIIWVNAKTGETPTVVTATEQALENRVQRVESFTARTRAVAAHPDGSVVDRDRVRSQAILGGTVWTAARHYGVDGAPLSPTQVERFWLYVAKHKASDGDWEAEKRSSIECYGHVFEAEQVGDARWLGEGGYNVAHIWSQPKGTTEGTYRLRYVLELCDGDRREWTNIVEVR